MKSEKNTVIEVEIDNLGINGEGVARYNGKAVFIKNALVGEKVRAKIIYSKPSFCVAIVVDRITDSLMRVVPECPLFTKCGGCNIQHLSYDGQLEFKQKLVKDALERIGGVDVPVDACVGSDKQLRYRNKMSLPIRRINGEVRIGLFAEGSHRIVECNDCLLQPSWNSRLIDILRRFIADSGVSVYSDDDKKGKLRHLVVREVEGCLHVALVAASAIRLESIAQALDGEFDSYALYLNINKRNDNVILGDEWHTVKEKNVPELVQGFKTSIHPAGFFQVNDFIKGQIYNRAVQTVKSSSSEVVIDAYSGAGIMSAFFAKNAERVYAIEINKQAHESCEKLIKDNKIDNLYAINGDVKDKIATVLEENKNKRACVVLDPPRSGCNESVLNAICAYGIPTILYISCNPATLARDVGYLKEYYEIDSVTPYDMFPQTANVETLVVLSHKR